MQKQHSPFLGAVDKQWHVINYYRISEEEHNSAPAMTAAHVPPPNTYLSFGISTPS